MRNRGLWPPDTITCQELVELVTAYLDGALPDDERTRFENHLKTCGSCQTYLEQLRQTIDTTGKLTEESVEPRARDELLTAFRAWKSG